MANAVNENVFILNHLSLLYIDSTNSSKLSPLGRAIIVFLQRALHYNELREISMI